MTRTIEYGMDSSASASAGFSSSTHCPAVTDLLKTIPPPSFPTHRTLIFPCVCCSRRLQVLKAKEVPRGVEAKENTSPRSWALPGSKQWRARNTNAKESGEGYSKPAASSKTDHMVSLLHGVSVVCYGGVVRFCECRCSRARIVEPQF